MLLVLCSRADRAALDFAKRHANDGVRAVTCADVSRPGWKIALRRGVDGAIGATLAAGFSDGRVGGDQIDGVITRLGHVSEAELGHVVPEDRPYIAAEMQAFLFAFLNALACRKVNRPSLGCLYAPHLRASEWKRLARGLGLAVDDSASVTVGVTTGALIDITVAGEHVWGDASAPLREATQRLALAADVTYLRARYAVTSRDARLWGADAYPRLESEDVGSALIRCCHDGGVS
jgi:hypothetical protein